MGSEAMLFAGARISSGRKPVTFAALNDRLEIVLSTQLDLSEVIHCLVDYEHVLVAIHSSNTKTGGEIFQKFQESIGDAGFKPYATKDSPRLWIESNADECYRVFQPRMLPRQSVEGRLQRALILYEEGLQIPDPMDFFEEITRHKILQGVLPTEGLYSSRQLDALAMACIAWMAGTGAENVDTRGQLLLPKLKESD